MGMVMIISKAGKYDSASTANYSQKQEPAKDKGEGWWVQKDEKNKDFFFSF